MAELARELAELTLELADELDEPRLVHATHAIDGGPDSRVRVTLAADVRRV